VNRVAGLEPDDALPAALGEDRPRVARVLMQLGEGRRLALERGDRAGDVAVGLAVEARHAGMGVVRRAEAAFSLALLVVGIDLLDLKDGQRAAALVGERDAITARIALDRETDREGPGKPARETHVLDDPLVIRRGHEALERRQRPRGEHVEVGQLARGQRDRLERLDVVRALARPVDQLAAVRLDELIGGDGAHAFTPAVTRPISSSFAMTACALSSGEAPSVSMTISAFSGSS
jgi:hypothetical protein